MTLNEVRPAGISEDGGANGTERASTKPPQREVQGNVKLLLLSCLGYGLSQRCGKV